MDWRLWKFLHYFHFDRVYWYVLENFSRPCVLCSTKCTTIYVSKTIVFVYVVKLLYSLPLYLSPCLCWQNKPVFMFVVVVCLSGDEQGAAVLSLSVSHYVSWQNKPVPMFCCCCLLMSKEQLYCLSLSLTSHLFVDKTNRFRCFVVVVRWWARSSCTVSLYLLLCLLTTQTGVECLLLLFIRWWAKSSCSVSLSLSYYVCWQYKPVLMFCCCCLSGDEQRAAVWSFPADSQHQKVWAPATLQRNAGT